MADGLIDSAKPMCTCGHTVEGHDIGGCFACTGPECDIVPREAVARVLYASFGRHETGRSWDDLNDGALRDHFYDQAERVLQAVETYGGHLW